MTIKRSGFRLWNVETGNEVRTFGGNPDNVTSVAISPDGRYVAGGIGGLGNDHTIWLWDTTTGTLVRRFDGHTSAIELVAFSDDGRFIVSSNGDDTARLWDTKAGALVHTFGGKTDRVLSVAVSPDGRSVATADFDKTVRLWDTESRAEIRRFVGHTDFVKSVAFSPDGKRLVSSGWDQTVRLWDVGTGRQIRIFKGNAVTVTFSPTGRYILVRLGSEETVRLWNVNTGAEVMKFDDGAVSMAFSPDGRAYASAWHNILLWNAETGRQIKIFDGDFRSVAFSPDGRYLAGGGRNIVLLDPRTGKEMKRFEGISGSIISLIFSHDGRYIAGGGTDGTIKLWDVASGKELCNLIALDENDWTVITPDGSFDGSPGAWKKLLWRYQGNTFDVTPVEAYFDDFYYPGLLSDIVSGKSPKAKLSLNNIDRRQLKVGFSVVGQPEGGRASDSRTIKVNIEVEESPDTDTIPEMAGRGSKWWPAGGARDLRLFRNGLLVKLWSGDLLAPNKNGCELQPPQKPKAPRRAICTANLPIVAGENNLTAYAFNHDNVKSSDATLTVKGAESLKRKGVAYILAVGVNNYADAEYNLTYAVPDAKDFSDEVKRQQDKLGNYGQVEVLSLNDKDATKANILKALADISAKIQPEDSLTIYFAGHGTAEGNRFYLIPHDLGYTGSREKLDDAGLKTILAHSISDEELEAAVEGIDAGQMLLVIDACNSGQALEAEEKRRGPMNSKGLAQLAYEKGMYILTAAQSYQAAKEAAKLGHGFLTYALVEEGLKTPAADREPKDGQVLLREWLDFATQRVPQMQEDEASKKRELEREKGSPPAKSATDETNIQRPRVFYRRETEPHPMVVARP